MRALVWHRAFLAVATFSACASASATGEEPPYVAAYRDSLPGWYRALRAETDVSLRWAAARQLGRRKWEDFGMVESCSRRMDVLKTALEDPDCLVRLYSASSLWSLGSPAGIAVLRAHATDPSCDTPASDGSLFPESIGAMIQQTPGRSC